MPNEHSPVYVFNTHVEAENAIHALCGAGFDIKKLALVGKDYHTEEHPVGFYTVSERIKSWGIGGAFRGSICGLLLAPAVFFRPGAGLLAFAGPILATLVGALGGAVVVGGAAALAAALMHAGVPKKQVIVYATHVKVEKYLLIVHGSEDDRATVNSVLARSMTQAEAIAETVSQ